MQNAKNIQQDYDRRNPQGRTVNVSCEKWTRETKEEELDEIISLTDTVATQPPPPTFKQRWIPARTHATGWWPLTEQARQAAAQGCTNRQHQSRSQHDPATSSSPAHADGRAASQPSSATRNS